MKLKIGFIGVGAMGLSHLQAMHEEFGRHCAASAVCASSETNLQKARTIAPNAVIFSRAEDLIRSDLDAIFVSTPNHTHVPLALEVLRAKKHLFLEKPVGITRNECRQLLEASKSSDRVVMIGHELRCSPYFGKIKSLVDAGEIGKPQMVWTREFRGPLQKKSRDWIEDDRQSGGTLLDKNCHHFDLMNWWAGSRPKRVSAFGGRAIDRADGNDHQGLDHAVVNFEYENETRGSLQLCLFARDFPEEDLEMGVVGENGMLQTRLSSLEILQWRRGAGQKQPIVHSVPCKPGAGWGGHLGFSEIHESFILAIQQNKRPPTTVQDCIDGTLLAIAAEESIKRGEVVEV